jgi:hypothetical protein
MELVAVIGSFMLLAAGLVLVFEGWTRQQQLKLMRASNTRLLKR